MFTLTLSMAVPAKAELSSAIMTRLSAPLASMPLDDLTFASYCAHVGGHVEARSNIAPIPMTDRTEEDYF